ncbi:MAG: AEC family transporter [Clostridia bacterium]|nr:AEC family transporter [Clostridia bacterium]
MFDPKVFFLTLQNVAMLLIFIFTGYFLRRSGKLNRDSATVISILTTFVFSPAYTISNLPKTFTVANLWQNARLILISTLLILAAIFVARILGKTLGRDGFERRTFSYMFAFGNSGYFGYPVVQGVFGEEALGQFIIFCLPVNIAIFSYGYGLFVESQGGKFQAKKIFLSPMIIGCYIGCILGLTGFQLPSLVTSALSGAAACMSPASMILAGVVMGSFPLKKLVSGLRPYLLGLIRLLGLPLFFGVILYVLGLRGTELFLGLVSVSLPSGMNIVVYPESLGQDASANAKVCFVSVLMSLLTLPVVYSIIQTVAGL